MILYLDILVVAEKAGLVFCSCLSDNFSSQVAKAVLLCNLTELLLKNHV